MEFKEEQKFRDILDRIPVIPAGEKYIEMRYPISFLLSRSNIQVLASQNIDRKLTELEIQNLSDFEFAELFSDICVGVIDAVCETTGESRKNDEYKIML